MYEYESESDLVFRNFGLKLLLQNGPLSTGEDYVTRCSRIKSAVSPDVGTSKNDDGDQAFDRGVLLNDFLQGFCVISKDHSLSRGYLDGLPDLLERADLSTNVAKAAYAAALGCAGMRHQRRYILIEAEKVYGSLLRSFRKAIVEVEESTRIETFMTTVLLGLYEVDIQLRKLDNVLT